jgi:hypothetical protein
MITPALESQVTPLESIRIRRTSVTWIRIITRRYSSRG